MNDVPMAVIRIFTGLVTCAALAAPIEAQTRPISYDDYYRLVSVRNTEISPDGDRVAFVRSQVLEDENRTHSEVWMANTDGSEAPVRLTSPATEATAPRWSPDGALFFGRLRVHECVSRNNEVGFSGACSEPVVCRAAGP